MLFSSFTLAALAFVAVNGAPTVSRSSARSAAPIDNSALIAKLKTDATAAEQFQQLLANNGQPLDPSDLAAATVFDFTKNPSPAQGTQGGSLNTAGPKNFPILTDSGLSLNLLTLGPCGLFSPHIHPRANEFFLVLEGQVDFGFLLETGVFGGLGAPNPTISGTLKQHEGTLFPLGSVHWQINASPDCNNATTFEAFSSDDPGAVLILNKVSNDSRVLIPQIEPNDLDGLRAVLPPAILSEVDSCLARCNM
ncbi:RmlC-like cupin [Mollisia scopiformis]|uniref:RmlC-like cupin n=1 Tax=Mollisia scopiformis TaxID=149040 RepID=A0A194XQ39_MOLSC|nr:RmlC-like cupin [Mollisia scopiformis]KUJ22308.1 RmlC-like cupin [Mollisia scopiformis]